MHASGTWTTLDRGALRAWPLPEITPDADKETRGRVLLIAGSREIPGAAILAGTAALRAGAGKLVIATARSVAADLAICMPEARVIALPESAAGSFSPDAAALLEQSAQAADAVLVGPGLIDEDGSRAFVVRLLPTLTHAPGVLDALALNALPPRPGMTQSVLVSPHAGEMAHLRGMNKEAVLADPQNAAIDAAREWNAVVAVKGPCTVIAAPDSRQWRHESGHAGLATAGSGDVLAGLIAGLAARGAALEQACAWGVVLHAMAGKELARRYGALGYLARELPGEIP